MLTRDVHDQVVAQLYATAMGEMDWPTMLGRVADLFGHAAGVLVTFDPAKQQFNAPTVETVDAFTRLVPHIDQAWALAMLVERAASTQAMLLEALAARADGVILLDGAGRPGFVNDGARAILSGGDGLNWTLDGFATARGPETRRLRDMVQRVLSCRRRVDGGVPGGQLLVTRPSGRRPYIVRVLPAPAVERMLTHFEFACVVHIHDLGGGRIPQRGLLKEVFGLTGREADLAIELVRCRGLAAAAVAAGMAHNTARNHLHGIFAKCGVSNQAEAVHLLASLP